MSFRRVCVCVCARARARVCVCGGVAARRYKEDLFGLRTADEAGKILFNSTSGNHLQFTNGELLWWVDNYFVE